MTRAVGPLAALLLAGCASSTADYVARQEGVRVVSGYVIRLAGLADPDVRRLRDGTAYTATGEGASVTMEFPDGRRETWELRPGDVFVQSRPFSHLLLAPRPGG